VGAFEGCDLDGNGGLRLVLCADRTRAESSRLGNGGPSVRGRAFGIFDFTTSVTTLLASLITGEIWKHYGAPLPFALSAGLALVCALLLLASPKFRAAPGS